MGVQQTNTSSRRPAASRAGLLVVLGIAGILAGCKSEAAVQEQAVRPVKVTVVARATQGRALTYSGVVRPRIESGPLPGGRAWIVNPCSIPFVEF